MTVRFRLPLLLAIFVWFPPTKFCHALSHFELFHSWCQNVKPITPAEVRELEKINGMLGAPAFTPMPVPFQFYSESLKKAVLQGRFVDKTGTLELALGNPEFHRALETCFPNDPFSREYFVTSLVHLDQQAKLLGGMTVVLGLSAGGWALLSRLGRSGRWISVGLLITQAYFVALELRKAYLKFKNPDSPDAAFKSVMSNVVQSQITLEKQSLRTIEKDLSTDPNNALLLKMKQNIEQRLRRLENDLAFYSSASPEPSMAP